MWSRFGGLGVEHPHFSDSIDANRDNPKRDILTVEFLKSGGRMRLADAPPRSLPGPSRDVVLKQVSKVK